MSTTGELAPLVLFKGQASVIQINNPFEPHDRTLSQIEAGGVLSETFKVDFERHVFMHNGKLVDEEEFVLRPIRHGDTIVHCAIPAGGGQGKKGILRMVAMVALAVVAGPLGGALAGSLAGALSGGVLAASSALTMGMTMGVMMAGSMLINALLPVTPMEPANNNLSSSPTYGEDGAKLTSREGSIVGACYGRYRMAGNLIGCYTVNEGGTQYIHLLQNAGEGKVAGFENFQINDQPIDNFNDVQTQVRLGTESQTPIDWFEDTVRPISRPAELKLRQAVTHVTTDTVDRIRVDFVYGSGLYAVKKSNGGRKSFRVYHRIEWRNINDNAHYGSESIVHKDNSSSPVRKSFTTPVLEHGNYEIKITRTSSIDTDDGEIGYCSISDINEIVLDDVAYIHTALVATRVKYSGQLSGIPNVTFENLGREVRYYDEDTQSWKVGPSDNPAWITWDMMTHRRMGNMAEGRIDLERWIEWARFCRENDLTFRGNFDVESNLWDSMQYVFRAGRAQIVESGRFYSVAIERPELPVMTFNSANMDEDSFSLKWTPITERANEVEVSFADEENDYKRNTVKVYDPDIVTFDKEQKPSRLSMIGVVNAERALREGRLALNMTKYLRRTVSFTAGVDALLCTIGSVVFVQSTMAAWAFDGRIASGSTATKVKLDAAIELNPAETNILLVMHPVMRRVATTVDDVTGNRVYINGHTEHRVLRLVTPDGDRRIIAHGIDGLGFYVDVENADGINVGDTAELWDVDVIEERTVAVTAGESDTLTVSTAFSQAPALHTLWLAGPQKLVRKLFRITKMTRNDDLDHQITAIEYDERIYDDTVGSSAPVETPVRPYISHVRDLRAAMSVRYVGNTPLPLLGLSWIAPINGSYAGADVHVRYEEDDDWQLLQTVSAGAISYALSLPDVEAVEVRVVAFDAQGNRARPFDSAPTISTSITDDLEAAVQAPSVPSNLSVTGELFSMALTFDFEDYVGHAVTEIYCATQSDLSDQLYLDETPGRAYTHFHLGTGETRYYQIRTRNTLGQVSAMYPLEAVAGTTLQRSDALEDALEGRVSLDLLTSELSSEIELISAPDTTPGSVAERVKSARDEAKAGIESARAYADELRTSLDVVDLVMAPGELGSPRTQLMARARQIDSSVDRLRADTDASIRQTQDQLEDQAQASADEGQAIRDALEDRAGALQGYIDATSGRLDDEVVARQQQIEGLTTDLSQEAQDRIAADTAIEASVQVETDVRISEDARVARILTVLFARGGSSDPVYWSVADIPSNPPAGAYWIDQTGTKPTLKRRVSGAWQPVVGFDANSINALIVANQTASESRDEAIATDVELVRAGLALADENLAAESQAREATDARVTITEEGVATNAADIGEVRSDLAGVDDAQRATASALESATTRIAQTEQGLIATGDRLNAVELGLTDANDAIDAEVQARSLLTGRVETTEAGTTANAGEISDVKARLDDAEQGVAGNAAANQALDVRVAATEQSQSATAEDVTALEGELADVKTEQQAQGSALAAMGVTVEQQGDTLSTTSSDLTALRATVQQLKDTGTENLLGLDADDELLNKSITIDMTSAELAPGDTVSAYGDFSRPDGSRIDFVIEGLGADGGVLSNKTTSNVGAIDYAPAKVEGYTIHADAVSVRLRMGGASSGANRMGRNYSLNRGFFAVNFQAPPATAEALGAVRARVETAEGQIVAITEDVSAFESRVAGVESQSEANSQALTAVTTRSEQNEQGLAAAANDRAQLRADIDTADDKASSNAQALAETNVEVESIGQTQAAHGNRLNAIEVGLEDAAGGVAANAGAIQDTNARVAQTEQGIEGQAQDLLSLRSEFNEEREINLILPPGERPSLATRTQMSADAITRTTTRVAQTEQGLVSQSEDLVALRNDLSIAEQGVNANTQATQQIQSEVETLATGLAANVADVTALKGRADNADTQRQATIDAVDALTGELETVDDRTQVQAGQLTQIGARLDALRLEATSGFETGTAGYVGAPDGWNLDGSPVVRTYYSSRVNPNSSYGSALSYGHDGAGPAPGAWSITKAYTVAAGSGEFSVSVQTEVIAGHAYVLLTCLDGLGQTVGQFPSDEVPTGFDGLLTVSQTLPAATRYVELSLRASKLIAA